uniref:Uncharacterized protein n=1 Tax=Oryza sativa subsp. japonica TaxID=39947 RepID=Q6EPI9_ORYSJ|nr:hypothetical protein [Oryza sativa Japonica Group]
MAQQHDHSTGGSGGDHWRARWRRDGDRGLARRRRPQADAQEARRRRPLAGAQEARRRRRSSAAAVTAGRRAGGEAATAGLCGGKECWPVRRRRDGDRGPAWRQRPLAGTKGGAAATAGQCGPARRGAQGRPQVVLLDFVMLANIVLKFSEISFFKVC